MSLGLNNLLSPQDTVEPALTCVRDSQRKSSRRGRVPGYAILFVAVGLLLATSGSGAAQNEERSADMDSQPHNIKTVFVIIMENHNWTGGGSQSLRENAYAPYINETLVPMSSYARNYFNPPRMHPSLPNYLWLEAGTNFGILGGGGPYVNHQSTHEHLTALLEKKGITWRAYDERATGTDCSLRHWHTPFVFFDDETNNNDPHSAKCIEHNRPFRELKRDLDEDRAARYNFIVPALCDSMHSACGHDRAGNAIAEGDRWLAKTVPEILNSSAYRRDGVLFILWDEGRGTSDGPIPLFVLSPLAKGNGYSNHIHYTHGSTLRTIQEIFGVRPLLRDAAKQRDLRDLFIVFP